MLKIGIACIVVIVTLACQQPRQPVSESSLFRDFNLATLIDQVGECHLSGTRTGGNSYESQPILSKARRTYVLEYQLKESGSRFDEAVFVNRLAAKVSQEVRNAGAQIATVRRHDDGYALNYVAGVRKGAIEFKGVRFGRDTYKVSAEIREEVSN